MKDNKNFKWTKNDIAEEYKNENPNWTWEECMQKAKIIHKEINKLNDDMWQSTKVFFKMNTPFSFFDNRNDEFEEIFFDRNSQ